MPKKKSTKKSTKTVKQADSPQVKLDKDFRKMFPPNTAEKKAKLEKSILERGVREPLVVWKEENILIDGYHRYDICKEHKIAYKVRYKSFKNREEAKLWMWDNQIRRDLVTTLFQRIEIVLQFKGAIAARAKANKRAGGGAVPTKLEEAVDTYKILGEMSGTSHGTVRKAELILKEATEEEKEALRNRKAKISPIYNKYKPPTTPKPSSTKSSSETVTEQAVSQTKAVIKPATSDDRPFFDDDQPAEKHGKQGKTMTAFLPTEEEFDERKGKSLRDQIQYVYSILEKLADKIAEEHPTNEDCIALYKQIGVWADSKRNAIVKQQKQK